MQIGSTATYLPATQASLPANLRAPAATEAIPPITAVEASPDATVTLSADGTRLAAQEKEPSAGDTPQDPAQNTDETDPRQVQLDRQKISELASRDADVRSHEAAHASVGGAYAGSPSYTMQRGPDGKSYAIGGEVGIDVSAVANDPAATISKMEVVMRAALAPVDPSAQDLRVAAQAQGLASAARAELAQERRAERTAAAEEKRAAEKEQNPDADSAPTSDSSASLQVYQSIAAPLDSTPQIETYA
ncbi:MAG: putative metalloprotease CJM1_0395 family protein [Pseudomonas sp.]